MRDQITSTNPDSARTFEWTNLSLKQIRVGDNKGGQNSATTFRLLSAF